MSERTKYETVVGLEVHVELHTKIQNFLRLLHLLRRTAEYAYLSGLSRASRRAAGAEPSSGRICDESRDGA